MRKCLGCTLRFALMSLILVPYPSLFKIADNLLAAFIEWHLTASLLLKVVSLIVYRLLLM
jgi:hypothetical protein